MFEKFDYTGYITQPLNEMDSILDIGQRYIHFGCFKAKKSEIKDVRINYELSEVIIAVIYSNGVKKAYRIKTDEPEKARQLIQASLR